MDADFDSRLDEALADPEGADFAGLRAAYASSAHYLPFGRDQGGLEALHRLIESGAWEPAREMVEALLEGDPLSVSLRFAYAHVLEGLDEEWEASSQRSFADGLLRSILRTGDGRTPATAIQVLDMREMYLVLETMGLRVTRSQLSQIDEEWIDLVEVRGPEGDREMYFNVTLPQTWLAQVDEQGD